MGGTDVQPQTGVVLPRYPRLSHGGAQEGGEGKGSGLAVPEEVGVVDADAAEGQTPSGFRLEVMSQAAVMRRWRGGWRPPMTLAMKRGIRQPRRWG